MGVSEQNLMKTLIGLVGIVAILAVLVIGCQGENLNGAAEKTLPDHETDIDPHKSSIIFASGFEEGVTLAGPVANPSKFWTHALTGTDSETGYTWPTDLPGGLDASQNRFYYYVYINKDLEDYIRTRIEEVIGRDGEPTRALYMEVRADDPDDEPRVTRNTFNIKVPNESPSELDELYVRYWMKLQPDLAQNWKKMNVWRTYNEVWEEGLATRISFYIERGPRAPTSNNLYWMLKSDTRPCTQQGCVFEPPHFINISPLEVPLDEWFLIETYWKHSETDGIIWTKINGEEIHRHEGPNSQGEPLTAFNLFKVYTSESFMEEGPAYHWVDDVVICRNPTCID